MKVVCENFSKFNKSAHLENLVFFCENIFSRQRKLKMEPEDWGKYFWFTGHAVSFYFPEDPTEEEQQAAKSFYLSWAYLLPCDTCCEEYSKLIYENEIDDHLSGPDALSRWFFNIHEKVNMRLGKSSNLTYEEVKNNYMLENQTQEIFETIPAPIIEKSVPAPIIEKPKYKVNTAVFDNFYPKNPTQGQQNFNRNTHQNFNRNAQNFNKNIHHPGQNQQNRMIRSTGQNTNYYNFSNNPRARAAAINAAEQQKRNERRGCSGCGRSRRRTKRG